MQELDNRAQHVPTRVIVGLALLALALGVICNYESWFSKSDNYDLWTLYVRWWLVAFPLGFACAKALPVCTLLYVLPSAAVRFNHFAGAQFAESNLMPMMLLFESIAGLLCAVLVVIGGVIGRKLIGKSGHDGPIK